LLCAMATAVPNSSKYSFVLWATSHLGPIVGNVILRVGHSCGQQQGIWFCALGTAVANSRESGSALWATGMANYRGEKGSVPKFIITKFKCNKIYT
jgi:hypothetical protein